MKCSLVCASLAALVLGFALSASAHDVVLPAGTLLQCTLNEPNFSAATAAVGDPVLCHLHGLTEFGQQAFPRGAYLVGHLEAAKDPGHFFGKGNMKLQFDRIGLPSGDVPLDAKVIATRGYHVDREGDILGKGHAKRDVVEWMLPPLWPWKVIMLPARGPRPALKNETAVMLRLMDDIELPAVVHGAALYGPGWHYFNESKDESLREAPASDRNDALARPSAELKVAELRPVAVAPQASYASFVSRALPAASATLPIDAAPGRPVFVLKSGGILEVGNYSYQDHRVFYTLADGTAGALGADEIDWVATTRVNSQRGVRVTLRAGHPVLGTPGM